MSPITVGGVPAAGTTPADNSVTSAKIVDATIVAGDIADSAVTSAKILDGAVVDADVNASAAIVESKLSRYDWTPLDYGMLGWTYDPSLIAGNSANALATAGTVYTIRLKLPAAVSVTNILIAINGGGSSLTSGQCFAGLFNASKQLIGVTADQSTAWASSGNKTMALSGGPFSAGPGVVIVGLFFNGTTGPSLLRTTQSQNSPNFGLSTANSRWGTADTGRTTTFPSTLGTITNQTVAAWWVGLS